MSRINFVELKKIAYKSNFIFSSGLMTNILDCTPDRFTRMSQILSLNMPNIFSAGHVLPIRVSTSVSGIIMYPNQKSKRTFQFLIFPSSPHQSTALTLCMIF